MMGALPADSSYTARGILTSSLKIGWTVSRRAKTFVGLELNNPATTLAVQIQTTDYHMIGWAPRYLLE